MAAFRAGCAATDRRTSRGGRTADTGSLYYLATMATGTWIAQSHTVLPGDHR